MRTFLIFVWVYAAMVAMSFWEAYIEGRNAWDRGKLGWRVRFGKFTVLTAYHFFNFWVMWPLLLTLPFVIYGWDIRLFGVVVSAYFSGVVVEDFMWYVVNPVVKLSEFNPEFANYYPWVKIGRLIIPAGYIVCIGLAIVSWYFLWR